VPHVWAIQFAWEIYRTFEQTQTLHLRFDFPLRAVDHGSLAFRMVCSEKICFSAIAPATFGSAISAISARDYFLKIFVLILSPARATRDLI
jgi:hypothetical protein